VKTDELPSGKKSGQNVRVPRTSASQSTPETSLKSWERGHSVRSFSRLPVELLALRHRWPRKTL